MHSDGALSERCSERERDDLTGLASRSKLVASLRARAERALSDGLVFGLVIVDFDHFKKINLSHGPTCGDAVLRDAAQRLVRTISADASSGRDAVTARYDGDAFALLVESRTPRALATAAEIVRQAVAAAAPAADLRLTVSVGAAQTRIGESADALLVRAEQALYLAKQFGRDRIEIARAPTPMRAPATVSALRRSA